MRDLSVCRRRKKADALIFVSSVNIAQLQSVMTLKGQKYHARAS